MNGPVIRKRKNNKTEHIRIVKTCLFSVGFVLANAYRQRQYRLTRRQQLRPAEEIQKRKSSSPVTNQSNRPEYYRSIGSIFIRVLIRCRFDFRILMDDDLKADGSFALAISGNKYITPYNVSWFASEYFKEVAMGKRVYVYCYRLTFWLMTSFTRTANVFFFFFF